MNNSFNDNFLDETAKKSGGKIDRKAINNAIKSGDSTALVNSLSDEDKAKLNNILSDKEALEKILKNPLAAELMKRFGGGKNG